MLVDELGELVAIDPVLLHDLRRMHLVIKSIVLSLAIQVAVCVITILLVLSLVWSPLLLLLFFLLLNVVLCPAEDGVKDI